MPDKGSAVETVFSLYKKYGHYAYLDQGVNQLEHATQCAMLAEKEGFPPEVVLGAFLHDVGHLVGTDRNLDLMITDGKIIGAQHHDIVGEQYLKELGFPEAVTDFVRGHVSAKRYLVHKIPNYYDLSSDIIPF